jgi:hypothetical protein
VEGDRSGPQRREIYDTRPLGGNDSFVFNHTGCAARASCRPQRRGDDRARVGGLRAHQSTPMMTWMRSARTSVSFWNTRCTAATSARAQHRATGASGYIHSAASDSGGRLPEITATAQQTCVAHVENLGGLLHTPIRVNRRTIKRMTLPQAPTRIFFRSPSCRSPSLRRRTAQVSAGPLRVQRDAPRARPQCVVQEGLFAARELQRLPAQPSGAALVSSGASKHALRAVRTASCLGRFCLLNSCSFRTSSCADGPASRRKLRAVTHPGQPLCSREAHDPGALAGLHLAVAAAAHEQRLVVRLRAERRASEQSAAGRAGATGRRKADTSGMKSQFHSMLRKNCSHPPGRCASDKPRALAGCTRVP